MRDRPVDGIQVVQAQAALDLAQGVDRPAGNLRGFGQRVLEQVRVGQHVGGNTVVQGLIRIHPLGGVEQLGGALRADIGLQHVTAAPLRHQCEAGEGQAQAQALSHINHIGMKQDSGPTAHRHSLRRRHHGLVELDHGPGGGLEGVLFPSSRIAEAGQVYA